MAPDKLTNTTLIGGAAAAIAASACCLGPLVLVSIGVGGAWISNLTMLETYRPLFIGIALMCMVFAYRQIYSSKPAIACLPDTLCAKPKTNRNYRTMFWIVSALVLIALLYPYFVTLFE